MTKKTFIALVFIFTAGSLFSQEKHGRHSLSLGGGHIYNYNKTAFPYDFMGTGLSFDYNYDKYLKRNRRTFLDMNLSIAPLKWDKKFTDNLIYNALMMDVEMNIEKFFLKRIFETKNFSTYAGFVTAFQSKLNVHIYDANQNNEISLLSPEIFFSLGISAGASVSFQLKTRKATFRNTVSGMLFTAGYYPNYSHDIPILNDGSAKDYFIFATVNKRTAIKNRFTFEFPLIIGKKYINSFILAHNFRYEYSTIKDNLFYNISNYFTVGMVFNLSKIKP